MKPFELKAMTYEEARREHFTLLTNKAKRKMDYWSARLDKTRPDNLMDEAHIRASDAGWEYNFYKDALEALDAQPKWISVEERLPENGKWVLAYCAGYANWFCLNKWCGNCWLNHMPITHWMLLPASPEEVK